MGKFEQHLAKPQKFTVDYADGRTEEIELVPLGFEWTKDLMMIAKNFSDETVTNPMRDLDETTVERMQKVVLETMKRSYPNEPENELKAFAAKNFPQLIPFIVELNFNVGSEEKLAEMRKRIKDAGKIQTNKTTV